ncbi:LLM class flavin-dependent oxidoreductase [Pseudooceanicola sp. CBS1P-1]|uniref:LLM class flavin-dependent oxidoreductase n=1 Tax=Pseudooceanicola albus TaxID=2692189 RepID=A0A6L7G9U1_9RHOB|nr:MULTISPECIES: LLM class flavin-dependent oxidoreductase [Pseudooceanicola]MBT9386248.1 LLM class flavin-dependent oxidoreductase [Pseudooceanicola endophyticus]MXN20298.1 LLM class flavin-dependent oxidoreductase [Pseudooceanicola albus]
MNLYTTAPASTRFQPGSYLGAVRDLARWSEAAGLDGMLIYTDNSLADPWCVAQTVLEGTRNFRPLIAVQPLYMSPLAAARKISSLAFLYGRRVALNMVSGGFSRDLEQLGDTADHDTRYDRLVEYTQLLQALLRGGPVTFQGRWYAVTNLTLSPALPEALMPEIFVSGASEACQAAAVSLGATRFSYTSPPADLARRAPLPGAGRLGLRAGIIAREDSRSAWTAALTRFPEDKRGQMAHRLARLKSQSRWHRDISELAEALPEARDGAYWLNPIRNYRTFCPYFVGSHGEVADLICGYDQLGYTTLILDVPESRADLEEAVRAVRLARTLPTGRLALPQA